MKHETFHAISMSTLKWMNENRRDRHIEPKRAFVIKPTSQITSSVTPRAISIGLVCVSAICAVEAYNDYYVNNTWLAAHHFPIVAAFLMMVLILGVNGGLSQTRRLTPLTPGQFPMNNIWFSISLGWCFKSLIIRHGGLRGYRRARPIFLGAVLGECTIAGVSATIGLFTGKGYNFLYF